MNLRSRLARRDGAEINITPLVDVVFILLIFLLISTTFRTREHAFTIVLPKATEKRTLVSAKRPTVYVTREGAYYFYTPDRAQGGEVEGLPIKSLRDLQLRLEELRSRDPDTSISVKADSDTDYQKVMDVVNQCYRVGIERVSFPFQPARE